MSAIDDFDRLFMRLSETEKKELLTHVYNNHLRKRITEGLFGGPAVVTKGLFGGPAGSTQQVCPTCHRPY
jgi:hypothetical protein